MLFQQDEATRFSSLKASVYAVFQLSRKPKGKLYWRRTFIPETKELEGYNKDRAMKQGG